MKQLIQIARNVSLTPLEEPPLTLAVMVELILTLAEPTYVPSPLGTSKSANTETVRFITSPDGLRDLAERLTHYADKADEEMQPWLEFKPAARGESNA